MHGINVHDQPCILLQGGHVYLTAPLHGLSRLLHTCTIKIGVTSGNPPDTGHEIRISMQALYCAKPQRPEGIALIASAGLKPLRFPVHLPSSAADDNQETRASQGTIS